MQLICKCFSALTLSLHLHDALNCAMGEHGEYDPWKYLTS